MLKIELTAAANQQPGYGRLLVHGWKGDTEALELSIQRNQDQQYLGDQGTWVSHPVWHGLPLEAQGEGLLGDVGPWLVDALVLDPQMVYMLQLRQAGQADRGVLRLVGNILSSQAAGHSLHEETRIDRAPTPPAPTPPIVAPAPVREDEQLSAQREADAEPLAEQASLKADAEDIRPIAPIKKRSNTGLWIFLGLLLLALIGAGAWWWLQQRPLTSPEPVPASTPAVANPPAAETSVAPAAPPAANPETACAPAALQQNSDDLAFIRGCLEGKPSSQKVLEVIAAAKAAKRCNLVQRLYAHKAQSGDAVVALAYAREYDPKTHSADSCIKSADVETALYWYELVLSADAGNAAARERLEALKK